MIRVPVEQPPRVALWRVICLAMIGFAGGGGLGWWLAIPVVTPLVPAVSDPASAVRASNPLRAPVADGDSVEQPGRDLGSRSSTQPPVDDPDSGPDGESQPPRDRAASRRGEGRLRFTRRAKQAGIDFVYAGGPSERHDMTEQNGGGIAVLDYDRDGHPDLYFSNGARFGSPSPKRLAAALYRQHETWRFLDTAGVAGVAAYGFGMGCAAGDFDNDGFPDLFLAGYGPDRLWRNLGDGTFAEVTSSADVSRPEWTSSAAWADFDGDGDLDLIAVNYVEWTERDPPCFKPHSPAPLRVVCGPLGRPGCVTHLFENLGDGRFRQATKGAGFAEQPGKSLDVIAGDLNGDGRLDAYVANDTAPNQLWRNQGGLRFVEEAVVRGCALNREGVAASGMGIGVADGLGTGRFDLVVTNFEHEPNDYYHDLGEGQFEVRGGPLGLEIDSRPLLGFGVAFSDFDGDGWPDLFVANGHVWDLTPLGPAHRYRMPPLLYANQAGQAFRRSGSEAGDYFEGTWLGRAVATGDLDRDGDLDLAVGHLESPYELLENESSRVSRSVRLRFVGVRESRDPLGCRIEVTVGSRRVVLWVPAGGGFQASSDPVLCVPTFGRATLDRISITWPSGETSVWSNVPATVGQDLILREGDELVRERARGK